MTRVISTATAVPFEIIYFVLFGPPAPKGRDGNRVSTLFHKVHMQVDTRY